MVAMGPEDESRADKIKQVVKVLHDGGFVHRDIRDVNIMVRHKWDSGNGGGTCSFLTLTELAWKGW